MSELNLEEKDKLYLAVQNEINKHTIQLLKMVRAGYFESFATGVLVKLENKEILCTASHVINGDTPIFLRTVNGTTEVVGQFNYTDPNNKLIDLAYVVLSPQMAYILSKTHKFLPSNKIITRQLGKDEIYLTVGYPVANEHIDKASGQRATGTSGFIVTSSNDKVFKYHNFYKELHCVFNLYGKGRDILNKKRKSKLLPLYGMSGCGIWLINTTFIDGHPKFDYTLVGISTDFRNGKYHCYVGNRIEYLITALIINEKISIRNL